MKTKIIFSLISALFLTVSLKAQYSSEDVFLKKYSISVGASASFAPGLSFEGATSISNRVSFRAGATYIPTTFSISYVSRFSPQYFQDEKVKIYIAEKNVDPLFVSSMKFSTLTGQFLFDFTPAKDGFFHLTAGLYFGGAKVFLDGELINGNTKKNLIEQLKDDKVITETPTANHDLAKFKPNADGSASAILSLGNVVKPYLGIGLGRAIPHSRVGIKAEFGVLYVGGITLSSSHIMHKDGTAFNNENVTPIFKHVLANEKKEDAQGYAGHSKASDYLRLMKYAQFSPVINLKLVLRLN